MDVDNLRKSLLTLVHVIKDNLIALYAIQPSNIIIL